MTLLIECARCDGCGWVANSDDEEPWTAWLALPHGSDIAVRLGVVQPKPCGKCQGTGTLMQPDIGEATPTGNPKPIPTRKDV